MKILSQAEPSHSTLSAKGSCISEDQLRRHYLESAIGIPFTEGNSIEVLRNGVEIFPAMLEAIEQAQESILFETYVYWTGSIAERFSKLLAKRAAEGLEVRVLLDSHGAARMKRSYLKNMLDAGVKVAWFRPLSWRIWDYDKRTHRKILVCDNQVGFTGGVGIAEEWQGDAQNEKEWRETHFCLRGPAVYGLAGAFWNNWIDLDGETLPNNASTLSDPPLSGGETPIMVARSSPATHQSEMELIFEALLTAAKKRVSITTPYFNIRQSTIDLIRKRAAEGVVFEFLLPGDNIDKSIELPVADECIAPLIGNPNIKFFRYQRSMIHAKVIRVDDSLACVGSPNFNQRSRKKDFEVALIVDDRSIAKTLDQHFHDDLSLSKRISVEDVRSPSLPSRILRKFLLLFREQL